MHGVSPLPHVMLQFLLANYKNVFLFFSDLWFCSLYGIKFQVLQPILYEVAAEVLILID